MQRQTLFIDVLFINYHIPSFQFHIVLKLYQILPLKLNQYQIVFLPLTFFRKFYSFQSPWCFCLLHVSHHTLIFYHVNNLLHNYLYCLFANYMLK